MVLGAEGGFEVLSRDSGGGSGWEVHAEGRMGSFGGDGQGMDVVALRESLTAVAVEDFYRKVGEGGVEYGPAFRVIERLWRGQGEALGELVLPAALAGESLGAHPALLDGWFQVLGGVLGPTEVEGVWLPFGWEALWVSGRLPERLYCRARLRAGSVMGAEDASKETWTADLDLYTPDGEVVGGVSGFVLRRAEQGALLGSRVQGLLYEVAWREGSAVGPRSAAEVSSEEGTGGIGLYVLSGGGALARELARELEGREQRAVRGPEDADRDGWRSFFASLPQDAALRGVAHLAGVREDEAGLTTEELETAVASVGRSGLALVQGLVDAGVRPSLGVWLVTRGGQVLEGERGGAFSGASLWGFGATVGLEHGELGLRLLDLDPGEEPPVGVLADELLHPDRETRVAHRGGKRRVARLARLSGALPEMERVRGDRSYLVTGGLGGIGLSVAGWLADRGAGAIVLNARRAPGESAAAAVEKLRGRGVEVRVELADVTDGEAVTGLLSRVEAESPPLGGVIHSVGVLSDGAVGNLDWGRFEEVLWPKVLGAWRLHRATVDRDLDLFVLFSSAAGVFGNAGQANYAAANAFLDQLARHRRALGLPGQAIAWGAWSEIGMAAAGSSRVAERLEEGAVRSLRPEQGLAALSRLVGADVGTSVVVAVDWSALPLHPPLLEEVAPLPRPAEGGASLAPRHGPPEVGELLSERIRNAPESERERLVSVFLQSEVQQILRLSSPPGLDVGFLELGMDSLMAVEFRNRLQSVIGDAWTAPTTMAFDYPNIARLARHLVGKLSGAVRATSAPRLRPASRIEGGPIALIGLAGRFPGAGDIGAFARSLAAGFDGIRPHRPGGLPGHPENEAAPTPTGYLEGIDRFDAEFFGIPEVEAKVMEPQQRLLLETSWHALEDAGIRPGSLDGSRTGVYAALGSANREFGSVLGPGKAASFTMYDLTGSDPATAVGRIAYLFRLEGPAIVVDTACSSSLVAIHQAIVDLERGDTDLALAGGANVILSDVGTRVLFQSGMLSARGRCSAFDTAADGYVRGEGCGMVVLKRLAEADAAGDRILAIVRGSAVNQDGARSALSAPAGPGQRRVMEDALRRARLDPSEVDYLEAHGIGSALGDPIEVNAAAEVYGRNRPAERPLLLGSVKTNIGHLEAAAGVAAVIKAVLAIRSRAIPRQLHFRHPNPHAAWEEAPLRVVSEPVPWPDDLGRPRRAAVSAFGISGTNAHLLLEEHGASAADLGEVVGAPRTVPVPVPEGVAAAASSVQVSAGRPRRLLPLSAKSSGRLRALAKRYLELLDGAASRSDPLDLADLAWSAGVGRQHLSHRAGLVFEGPEDLREQLRALTGRRSGRPVRPPRKVAFAFSGDSGSWSGRERILFETEPVARAVLDHCDAVLAEVGAPSASEELFQGSAESGPAVAAVARACGLYTLQAALAALWSGLGVSPAVVSGTGVGAFTAGYAAGVFGLDDGLRLAALRGLRRGIAGRRTLKLLACGSGARARSAVREVAAAVEPRELFAVPQAPGRQIVCGPAEAVSKVEERLVALGQRPELHPARTGVAADLLRKALSDTELREPSAGVHRGRSGRRVPAGALRDPAYWHRRLLDRAPRGSGPAWPVDPEVGLCVELGLRPSGQRPVAADAAGSGAARTLVESPCVSGETGAVEVARGFPDAAACAWEAGLEIGFQNLFAGEARRRIALPSYPFWRLRCWPTAVSGSEPTEVA